MSELFIHIGLHKTGSSSLQSWLSSNQENLGIIYPTFYESSNHSWPLSIIFGKNPRAHNSNRLMGYTAENIDEFTIEIMSRLSQHVNLSIESKKKLVISGEELSTFDHCEVQRLYDFFKKHFIRSKVIIYLRGIRGLLNSTIQQLIKDGLVDFNHIPLMTHLSIIKKIAPWIDIFGIENVIVRNNTGSNFEITSDFSRIIQISAIENNNLSIRLNKGISLEGLALIFRAWKFFKATTFPMTYQHTTMCEIREFYSKNFLSGSDFSVSKTVLEEYVQNYFLKDIEWIYSNFSIDINDIDYRNSAFPITSELDMLKVKIDNTFINSQPFQSLSAEAQAVIEATFLSDMNYLIT